MIFDELKLGEIDGWLEPEEAEWLYQTARALPAGAVAVEIGSFMGRSTCAIAAGIKEVGGWLHCFDTFDARGTCREAEIAERMRPDDRWLMQQFFGNIETRGFGPMISAYRVSSHNTEFAATVPDSEHSMLFIDGQHTREHVARDLELWVPKVKPGGIICGHDYHESWPGVIEAVDAHFSMAVTVHDQPVGAICLVENPVGSIWSVRK